MLTLLKKTPFQLFVALVMAYIFLPFLSLNHICFFFSVSQGLKDFMMIFLPFIIFFYLSSALASFEKEAPLLILAITSLVVLSNALTVFGVYGLLNISIGYLCSPLDGGLNVNQSQIITFFELPIKKIISTEWAMLIALLTSFSLMFLNTNIKERVHHFVYQGRTASTRFLKTFFVPLLPIYVFGYVLKLLYDGNLSSLINSYGKIFFVWLGLIFIYTFIFYFVANKGNINNTIYSLKNMLPAGFTGFSTMSSAAAMPLTLEASEKNLNLYKAPPSYSQFVVPFTTNIHLIGDGISLSLTALSLLYISGTPLPDFNTYMVFTFWYCLAKFSTAGVPGAGVLIILPVMQNYLHLNAELSSILTTIYILKDSLLTGANVMGNGSFAILSFNLLKNIFFKK